MSVTMNRTLTAQELGRAMNVTMTKTVSTQEPDRTMSKTMSKTRSTRGATCMRAGERGWSSW